MGYALIIWVLIGRMERNLILGITFHLIEWKGFLSSNSRGQLGGFYACFAAVLFGVSKTQLGASLRESIESREFMGKDT